MPSKSAKRSRSSNGRGGNTQQEPHFLTKGDAYQMVKDTAWCRKGAYSWNEQKEQHCAAESSEINKALKEALSTYNPNLAEEKVVQIIRDYISNDRSGETRYDIRRLQHSLEGRLVRGFTRVIQRITLKGKRRKLENQQGTPIGTPNSSDSEEDEDPPGSYNVANTVKVESNLLDGTKTLKPQKKIEKAARVTDLDDKALQLQDKNQKKLKKPKEEELIEPREKEAWSGYMTTKPAAFMSTHYLEPAAADVFKEGLHHQSNPTPTIPSSPEEIREYKLNPPLILCCDVRDLEQSSTAMPRPAVSASLKQTAVSMEKDEPTEEEYRLEERGSPLPSPLLSTNNFEVLNNGTTTNKPVKIKKAEQVTLVEDKALKPQLKKVTKADNVSFKDDKARKKIKKNIEAMPDKRDLIKKCLSRSDPHGKDRWVNSDPQKPRTTTKKVTEGRLKGGAKAKKTLPRKVQKRIRSITSKLSSTEKKLSKVFKGSSSSTENRGGLPKLVGLENLGNTCYLNAVLQSLRGCKLLTEEIAQSTRVNGQEHALSSKMQQLFQEMNNPGRTQPWSPIAIFEEICTWQRCSRYKDKKQQDAGELLSCILQELNEENETVGKLFMAEQRDTTRCKTCNEWTGREEWCALLTLSMEDSQSEDHNSLNKENSISTTTSPKTKNIEKLLTSSETWKNLPKGNEWYCKTCEELREAERQTTVVFAPPILAIWLKRFSWNDKEGGTGAKKITDTIKFKENLDLECKLLPLATKTSYRLNAIIEHNGTNTGNGHYVAYVREGDQWKMWSDDVGEPVTWETVEKSEAYIMIWERIEREDDWSHMTTEIEEQSNPTSSVSKRRRTDTEMITGREKPIWNQMESTKNTESVRREVNSNDVGTWEDSKDEVSSAEKNMEIKNADWKTTDKKGQKRTLESHTSINVMAEEIKLSPAAPVKRQRVSKENTKLTDEASIKGGLWNKKPEGTNKPVIYNGGETPVREESQERQLETEKREAKAWSVGRNLINKDTQQNTQVPREMCSLATLMKITEQAINDIKRLEHQIGQQNIEIIKLNRKVFALTTKVNVSLLDEDDERFMNEDIYKENLPGTSTPVDTQAAKNIINTEKKLNKNPGVERPTDSEQSREKHKIKKNDPQKDNRMEVEYWERPRERDERLKSTIDQPKSNNSYRRDPEWQERNRDRNEVQRSTDEQFNNKNPHEVYLEECFSQQIGLPIDQPQRINIYSYRDKIVANGYKRVVTTWQGMYYELTKQQVEWCQFPKRTTTVGGDYRWSAEGISVYNPVRERPSAAVVRHRFAILPPSSGCRKSLRTDRYYIHVYQTKIGVKRRTLHSKTIARELQRKFGKSYYPREVVRARQPVRYMESREPTKPQSSRRNPRIKNGEWDGRVRNEWTRVGREQGRIAGEKSWRPKREYRGVQTDQQGWQEKENKRWEKQRQQDKNNSSTSRITELARNLSSISRELAQCLEGAL